MVEVQGSSAIPATAAVPTGAQRVLGVPALVMIGLAANGVLTIFTSYGLVAQGTGGHLAAGYVFTTIAMAVTALSYVRMSQIITKGGSAYAYTEKAFGPHAGFMIGWTILLDYLFMPMAGFLLFGIYLNAQFPAVPIWVFTLAVIIGTFVANLLGTKFISRASGILICTTFGLVAVFLFLGSIYSESSFADGLASLVPTVSELPIVLSGISLLAVSFAGFDVISTMSEQAKDPTKTVPRATLICVVLLGAGSVVVAFVGAMIQPGVVFENVDAAALEIMDKIGGPALGAGFLVVYICCIVSSALVSQQTAARIIYAMGRDGVLPRKLFGRLVGKNQVPLGGSIFASLIGMVALFVSIESAFIMLAFGMLTAFCAVNLATFKHYVFDLRKRTPADLARYAVLPLLGFAMTVWLWSTLSGATFIFGISWMALGFAYLLYSTRLFKLTPPVLHF